MDDDFVKKRLERDLAELQRMCDDHFKKRATDEELLGQLEGRMSDRQKVKIFETAVHAGHWLSIMVLAYDHGPRRFEAVQGVP